MAKPGTAPVKAPIALFIVIIGTPAVVSSVGSLVARDSPALLAALGLSLVYTIVAALGLCYFLQVKAGKMQPGVYFPAISQLGVERPEQLLYQVGMALVSVCMFVAMLRLEDSLLPHYLAGKNVTATLATFDTFTACRKAGFIAAAGVCTQGLFTLELKLSAKSFIHWGGTAVFAYGAFQHCEAILRLLDQVASPLADVPAMQMSCAAKHAMLEKFPSMLFFLPILGQVLSAMGIGNGAAATNAANVDADADALHKKDDDRAEKPLVAERVAALSENAQKRVAAYEVSACRATATAGSAGIFFFFTLCWLVRQDSRWLECGVTLAELELGCDRDCSVDVVVSGGRRGCV